MCLAVGRSMPPRSPSFESPLDVCTGPALAGQIFPQALRGSLLPPPALPVPSPPLLPDLLFRIPSSRWFRRRHSFRELVSPPAAPRGSVVGPNAGSAPAIPSPSFRPSPRRPLPPAAPSIGFRPATATPAPRTLLYRACGPRGTWRAAGTVGAPALAGACSGRSSTTPGDRCYGELPIDLPATSGRPAGDPPPLDGQTPLCARVLQGA